MLQYFTGNSAMHRCHMKTITLTDEQAASLSEKLEIILTQGKGVDLWINGDGNDPLDPLLLDADEPAHVHLLEVFELLGNKADWGWFR